MTQPITIGLMNGRGKLKIHDGPGRLDLSEFLFEAIPYGLAYLNRFGGQAGTYSVAQHSVILSRIVGDNPLHKLAALLHDCGEPLGAGDTNTFLKRALGASQLSVYEDALCEAVWGWCRLPDTFTKYHAAVHPIDKALGTEEARQLGFPIPPSAPELSPEAKKKVSIRSDRWEPVAAKIIWEATWIKIRQEVS